MNIYSYIHILSSPENTWKEMEKAEKAENQKEKYLAFLSVS